MTMPEPARRIDEIIVEENAADNPTAWFERLYAEAAVGQATVPWDRHAPHQVLTEWAGQRADRAEGRRAVIVGCGTGDDAAYIAALGYDVTAFDISPSAIATAQARYPDTGIEFVAADLFDLPAAWRESFALVIESQTVQALPPSMREMVIAHVVSLVAPGGTLFVQAVADGEDDSGSGPPWPLTAADIGQFAAGLDPIDIARIPAPGQTEFHRWRAEFQRPTR